MFFIMPASSVATPSLYSEGEFFKLLRRCGNVYRIPNKGLGFKKYHSFFVVNNLALSSCVPQVPIGALMKLGYTDTERDPLKQGLLQCLTNLSLGNDMEELHRMVRIKAHEFVEDSHAMDHLNDLCLEVFGVRVHAVIDKSLSEIDAEVKEGMKDAEEETEKNKEEDLASKVANAAAKSVAIGVTKAIVKKICGDGTEEVEEDEEITEVCPSAPIKRKRVAPKLATLRNSKAARVIQFDEASSGGKDGDKSDAAHQSEVCDDSTYFIVEELEKMREEITDLEGGFDEFTDTINTTLNKWQEVFKRLDDFHHLMDSRLPTTTV